LEVSLAKIDKPFKEELQKVFDKHFNSIIQYFDVNNQRFDDIETQFSTINTPLDKIITKREEQNEEIRQSLKRI
jgi:vacuolar-type H+-ATPase subunit I/STV1